MVGIYLILFVVYDHFICSGGYFEDFIGGKCVFKESEWSDWNETVKDCSEKTDHEKPFFVLESKRTNVVEPKGTCYKTRPPTNESILAAGVCLGDKKRQGKKQQKYRALHQQYFQVLI